MTEPEEVSAVTTVRETGEPSLIAAVTARLPQGPGVEVGPGDDAAVVRAPDGRVVVTTDVLVEGVHFRRDWSSAEDVGRKAAAVNLADVMAMGAVGTALLVAVSLPGDLPLAWALGLADGLREEAARTGVPVVGGDTVRGDAVTITVTALGDLQGRPPVLRTGARVGDVVVHAGRLGASAAGLADLLAGRDGPHVAAHRCPEVPYALGPALAALGATAMCDVSDGLVADALTLAGSVALDLDEPEPEPGTTRAHALHGGEDHGLLATVPAPLLSAALALGARAVGRVVEGRGVRVAGVPTQPAGWEHFT